MINGRFDSVQLRRHPLGELLNRALRRLAVDRSAAFFFSSPKHLAKLHQQALLAHEVVELQVIRPVPGFRPRRRHRLAIARRPADDHHAGLGCAAIGEHEHRLLDHRRCSPAAKYAHLPACRRPVPPRKPCYQS
jgi:hypothetical protein